MKKIILLVLMVSATSNVLGWQSPKQIANALHKKQQQDKAAFKKKQQQDKAAFKKKLQQDLKKVHSTIRDTLKGTYTNSNECFHDPSEHLFEDSELNPAIESCQAVVKTLGLKGAHDTVDQCRDLIRTMCNSGGSKTKEENEACNGMNAPKLILESYETGEYE